jgi:N6-adenosine-specific RNA methylase IME4
VKQNLSGDGLHAGLGYYTRTNAEVCLLATKGSPRRLATDVQQIVMAPVGEHSAKHWSVDELDACFVVKDWPMRTIIS